MRFRGPEAPDDRSGCEPLASSGSCHPKEGCRQRQDNDDARCRQLRQIPGFGPLISTATVVAIGNGAAFRRGRDFAAWVGVGGVLSRYSIVNVDEGTVLAFDRAAELGQSAARCSTRT